MRILLTLSLALAPVLALAQDATKPPNIVVLVTDDQRWDAMRAAGNEQIHTPNMDKLAEGGVRFQNAFSTTAICCASRATLMTGMYSSTHGIEDFSTNLPPALFAKSYPALLREAGYSTAFVGKYGIGRNLPKEQFDYFNGFAGQGQYFNKVGDETVHMSDLIGRNAVEYLNTQDGAEPFCLSVSFKAPHVQDAHPKQFLSDPKFEELYARETMPVPDTATEKFFHSQPELVRDTEARHRWHRRFSNANHHQVSVKNYYRLVTGIDAAIGAMLDTLEARGLAENTVIVFTSDHGFFLGERGLAGKWFMYEESIRIPFIVYDPRVEVPQHLAVTDKTALTIDLAPTVLSFAGVTAPASMQGRDLSLFLTESPLEWRDGWFYEHHFARERKSFIPASEGVRTDDWKYIRWVDAEPVLEELYHIAEDPTEAHNLAGSPEHAEQLEEMRAAWSKWAKSFPKWDAPDADAWTEPSGD